MVRNGELKRIEKSIWTLRTATACDIQPILLQLSSHMNENQRTVFLDKVERYVRKPDRALFVAVDESRIAGFSCVIESADIPETLPKDIIHRLQGFAMTTGVLVQSPDRKQGIGTSLVRCLEQWALDRGRSGNWLVTHRKGDWYRRNLGYENVGRIVSKGTEKLIMAKTFLTLGRETD